MNKKHFLTLLILVALLYAFGRLIFFRPGQSVLNRESPLSESVRNLPQPPDSVTVRAGRDYSMGAFGRFFLGSHYRDVWAIPVTVPVFDMDTTKGGLQVEKLGGGMQTTSLTLTDKEGRKFALRSVDKDPVSVLPPFWRQTIAASFVRDQISATNPYAALVVPKLADAAGVFHANPKLVFIWPHDNHFGPYASRFHNRLFYIEEKFSSKKSLTPALGNATDLLSSVEMLQRRFDGQNHRIDARLFARCRLLDLLIGDWDRHEGQWNWAVYQKDSLYLYKPIPMDRDQVFGRYDDGLVPWLLTRRFLIRKFESFHPEYRDVYGLTINADFIDKRILSELTIVDFRRLAGELEEAITDSVINQAVKQFPKPVYDKIGNEIAANLKSRRNKLLEAAEEYYRLLSEEVLIVGTDEQECFKVTRVSDERTSVEVYTVPKEGWPAKKLYSRLFFTSETNTITLHGLGGDDIFEVTGKVHRGITVKIVGGPGADTITDTSDVAETGRRKTVVYDTKKGNTFNFGPETNDETTNDVKVHAFDREGY